MGHYHSCNKRRLAWIGILSLCVPFTFLQNSAQALTASVGQPYRGRLVNGVPFPTQFRGYQLRPAEKTYTTPEVIGAVLDAVDGVQKEYPDACDIYLGDFSTPDGGFLNHHRSHQNGRDVDIGMYAKGNRRLDTFMPMNEANLDVPKTWCFVESLLRTQRIQYIFLDRRVQQLLYEYALSRGVDETYLSRVFGNSKGAIMQHVVNHQDHMHVRFYTPWSTLASRVGETEAQKRTVIEMAQQAYLPKKVNYYVQGTERGLDALAQSFGVARRDLCRWNGMGPGDVMTPGSCLVFYKRGFELEPVHLAQSLRADLLPSFRVASYRSTRSLSDAPVSPESTPRTLSPLAEKTPAKITASPAVQTYSVKGGDTLGKIARESGMDLKTLCEMNRLKPNASLKRGQKLKVAASKASPPARVPTPTIGAAQSKGVSSPARSNIKAGRSSKAAAPASPSASAQATAGKKAVSSKAIDSSKPAISNSKSRTSTATQNVRDTKKGAAKTGSAQDKKSGKTPLKSAGLTSKKRTN